MRVALLLAALLHFLRVLPVAGLLGPALALGIVSLRLLRAFLLALRVARLVLLTLLSLRGLGLVRAWGALLALLALASAGLAVALCWDGFCLPSRGCWDWSWGWLASFCPRSTCCEFGSLPFWGLFCCGC